MVIRVKSITKMKLGEQIVFFMTTLDWVSAFIGDQELTYWKDLKSSFDSIFCHPFASIDNIQFQSNFPGYIDHDILTCYVNLAANASALKVSCELLRIFVTEAVQRAAFIAEAEEATVIEPTHFERVLPQLLLDF